MGVCAYDDERAFDTERLPYRFVDRAARPWGIGMIVGAILVIVLLAFEVLDPDYGDPASVAPGTFRTYEYLLGALAVFLAAGGTWLWPRYNVLEITSRHVRVSEHCLLGGASWVEPLSDYNLEVRSRHERNAESDWGDDSHSWTVHLVHELASRTILLRSRTLLLSDGCFKEFDGSFANVSKADVTEAFLDDAKRWARALDMPLWMMEE